MEHASRGKSRKRHLGTDYIQRDSRDGRHKKRRHTSGKPTIMILVPNFVVGKLIGKGGSNINELERDYSASISISQNKRTYPGTEDRIITISAETDQIIKLNNYIIEQVQTDKDDLTGDALRDGFRKHVVKIVVTDISVGLVIGKGGSTINAIENDSKAKINISKREESMVPGERIVTIAGSAEQRIEASRQIIEKVAEEPLNELNGSDYGTSRMDSAPRIGTAPLSMNHSANFSYASYPEDISSYYYGNIATNQYNLGSYGNIPTTLYNVGSLPCSSSVPYQPKSHVEVNFQVEMIIPNAIVGALMGKNGQTINEISKSSGAKITFSGKNDFVPGTTDRIVMIKGDFNQICNSYFLIDEKVAKVENELLSVAYR